MVGRHPMIFPGADNRSRNGGRVGRHRRNGARVDDGHQRLRACSECWRSPANQETGEHSSESLDSSFSTVFCRAGPFAQSPQIYQDWVSPGSPMYGGHPRISPQTNHSLGEPTDQSRQTGEIHTGSTAYLAPGRRRWHIRSAQGFTIKRMLAAAIFCQRDDPELSDPRNILPTLIHNLAVIFSPFRRAVAGRLHKDPDVTPESIQHTVFLDSIRALPRHPKKSLVLVIDGLDECGSAPNVRDTLQTLTRAAALAPWLKIVITSRHGDYIQDCFNALTPSTYLEHDLTADKDATSDLRIFAKDRFSRVASKRCLQRSWPEPSLLEKRFLRRRVCSCSSRLLLLPLSRARKDPTSFEGDFARLCQYWPDVSTRTLLEYLIQSTESA
jgi:hypothetical protein